MKFCKQCGTQLEDNAMFCAKCGTTVEMPEAEAQGNFGGYPVSGGFTENFRNKIGNNILFMVAIILSSAGVFLQLICNFIWLSYPTVGNIFLLLGTLFGAGVAIAALWVTFISSKNPSFPIGYNISFLVLKIFFIASLAWNGIWFIVNLVDAFDWISSYYSYTQEFGIMYLFETLFEKGATIAYLVFALLFAIKTEGYFKTNSGDWSGQKIFAIMSFVHAGGLIISTFIQFFYNVDILYILSTWTIAAASVLYGILVMKNTLAESSANDGYRPY